MDPTGNYRFRSSFIQRMRITPAHALLLKSRFVMQTDIAYETLWHPQLQHREESAPVA